LGFIWLILNRRGDWAWDVNFMRVFMREVLPAPRKRFRAGLFSTRLETEGNSTMTSVLFAPLSNFSSKDYWNWSRIVPASMAFTMRNSVRINIKGHGTRTTQSTNWFDTKCRQFHLLMVTVNRENWRSSDYFCILMF